MSSHVPDGAAICIHSVCVDSNKRRLGIALAMLQQYPAYIAQFQPPTERMLLICKEPLIDLYAKGGFELVGPSTVVHGADPWFEMHLMT